MVENYPPNVQAINGITSHECKKINTTHINKYFLSQKILYCRGYLQYRVSLPLIFLLPGLKELTKSLGRFLPQILIFYHIKYFSTTSAQISGTQTYRFTPPIVMRLSFFYQTMWEKTRHRLGQDLSMIPTNQHLMPVLSTITIPLLLSSRLIRFFFIYIIQSLAFFFCFFLGGDYFIYLISAPGFLLPVFFSNLRDFCFEFLYYQFFSLVFYHCIKFSTQRARLSDALRSVELIFNKKSNSKCVLCLLLNQVLIAVILHIYRFMTYIEINLKII